MIAKAQAAILLALAQPASKKHMAHRSAMASWVLGQTAKKNGGKHSTEDQFRLQNADHRPGQV